MHCARSESCRLDVKANNHETAKQTIRDRTYGIHALIRNWIILCWWIVSSVGGAVQSHASTTPKVIVQVITPEGLPLADAVVVVPGAGISAGPAQTRVMDQIHRAFVPHVLTLSAGDLVKFPNSDNIRHHVYSFSEPKPFEIRLYADAPKAPVEFPKAGVVVLGCNIHDDMVGYLFIAEPTDLARQTDDAGQVELPLMPTSLEVWHERYSVSASELMKLTESEITEKIVSQAEQLVQIQVVMPLAVNNEPAPTAIQPNRNLPAFGNPMRR